MPTDQPQPAPAAWRARESEWARIALVAALLSLLVSVWPGLDLLVSRWFLQPGQGFVGNQVPLVWGVYVLVPWLGRAAALAALLVALAWWRPPAWLGVRVWRRLVMLGLAMLVGVGALVNGALKEQWGRARPVEVLELGGHAPFSPALRPVAACQHNCSFVSGHAATGFVLMAVGALGAPATRRRWLRYGWVCGLLVGAGRIAQGGHFLSDVLFAGVLMWACTAALRHAWLLRRVAEQRRMRLRRTTAAPGAPTGPPRHSPQ